MSVSTPLLVAIFVLISKCHLAHAQFISNTYPIDWQAVPSAPSQKNITSSCICDLTDNACDTGCCCDPTCPYQATNITSKLGLCLPSGPDTTTLDYCIASSSVQKVNLNSGEFFIIPEVPANNKYIDQLLCIVSSANPNLGPVYSEPSSGNSGNNAILAGCPLPTGDPVKSNNYILSSPIFVKDPVNLNIIRPLTVPFPALSAQCLNTFQPGFLNTIPSVAASVYSECLQPTQDITTYGIQLATLCNEAYGSLSALSYTNISYLTTPTSSNLATVSLQIFSLNPLTGALTPVSSSSNYAPSYNATTGVCSNALNYLNLTFLYQGGGQGQNPMTISQVEISVVITSLLNTDPSFSQFVRVGFVQQQPPGVPPLITQQLSGAPGYLTGFPLLAGYLANKNVSGGGQLTAISRYASGFPLLAGDASGECSPRSLTPIKFGFNATTTCSVSRTLQQLNSLCVQNSTQPWALLEKMLGPFAAQLQQNNVYVGIWGNSNWTSYQDWTQAMQNGNSQYLHWLNGTNQCQNMVVGYDIQILTGLAFAANNAQKMVLYVNVCYRTATWTFPALADPYSSQRFWMTSTVSFIPLDQTPTYLQQPAPPLATPLPEEIFYPFVTSTANRVVASLGLTALVVLASIVSITCLI